MPKNINFTQSSYTLTLKWKNQTPEVVLKIQGVITNPDRLKQLMADLDKIHYSIVHRKYEFKLIKDW